ncbi:hypothetical protein DJ568_09795 [Mucilaginibacter hurinus]|uniref:Uncharacterized protein n=1 Tax=Mucilaginibacter hurinus TaxID=2201324 RepID=A0A367GQB1_9SPHI|nr:hypothetical protein [Mucilaginibacter hurinus]RCH55056.1 hypothetical protein DJ568_09795 [Mucilaginibacter hurinus]
METQKVVSGNTEGDVWNKIAADLKPDVFNYEVQINQGTHVVDLSIDIDLGGGFEGGFALTLFKAPVSVSSDFKFAVHDEGFIDEIGKFFGMQDVKIGYEELDRHLIVKTNDEKKLHHIFSDTETRTTLVELEDFDLGIHHHTTDAGESATLELNIDEGITDIAVLKKIYDAFYTVLSAIS